LLSIDQPHTAARSNPAATRCVASGEHTAATPRHFHEDKGDAAAAILKLIDGVKGNTTPRKVVTGRIVPGATARREPPARPHV